MRDIQRVLILGLEEDSEPRPVGGSGQDGIVRDFVPALDQIALDEFGGSLIGIRPRVEDDFVQVAVFVDEEDAPLEWGGESVSQAEVRG